MARSTSTTFPLKTLRDQATSLEASMLECLAKPAKKSVHKLRTATRRIEAQLELLAMLPELSIDGKLRRRLLQLLKKLRQAAGDVRDLDVQRDLIAEAVSGKKAPGDLRKEATQLRKQLKQRREKQAEDIVALLKKEQADLPLAFKKLFDSLPGADSLSISEADLTALVRSWYTRHTTVAAPAASLGDDDVERLHDIRKQAKLARYLAESAPSAADKARRLAARFEDLQEAGGQWHDWLLLAQIARAELGDSSTLAATFSARADKCLRSFQRQIEKTSAHAASRNPVARAA